MIPTLTLSGAPVALLGDSHFGARGDSQQFLDHFFKFFDEVFFPELIERGIKTVVQFGDLLDRRKFINFHTLKQFRIRVLEKSFKAGIRWVVLLGNHDIYFKNTVEVNGLEELFEARYSPDDFYLIKEPTNVVFGKASALVLPWICDGNRDACMAAVAESKADYMFGHLELGGFDMYKGVACEHGDDAADYKKFKAVYTGHFHTMSRKGNVMYLGTPYDITWADAPDDKGFVVLEPETGEETWVSNPVKIHQKIVYDDTDTDYDKLLVDGMAGKFVKVIVARTDNAKMLERLVGRLQEHSGAARVDVVEASHDRIGDDLDDDVAGGKDPLTLLIEEIDVRHEGSTGMKKKAHELYAEAMTESDE